MMKRRIAITIFSLCCSSSAWADTLLYSTTQGGNPAGGYQPATYTLADNTFTRGHFLFKRGITVGDNDFTWDADGFVNGTISVGNAGALKLSTDLRLGTTGTLSCVGDYLNIYGENKRIMLGGEMGLNQGIRAKSTLTLDGQGYTLTLTRGRDYGRFEIDGNTTVILKNMTIFCESVNDSNDYLFRRGNYILENVRIVCKPYADRIATLCSALDSGITTITIRGQVSIESPEMPIVMCKDGGAGALTLAINIEKNSTLTIGQGTVCALCYNSSDSACTINFTDRTSQLVLDGCDFYTSSVGGNGASALTALTLTKGTLLFRNKVRLFNALYNTSTYAAYTPINTDMSKALILGDGTSAGDMDVRVLGGAYVTVQGCINYNHS